MSLIHDLRRFFQHPHSNAIGLVFLASSWGFGSWVIHLPLVKSNLDVDEGTLGLLLFGMPTGQILSNLLASTFIQKFGLRNTCLIGGLLFSVIMVFPVLISRKELFFLTLFGMGMTYAFLNIAMNTISGVISKQLGYSIISTCHAMWSIGGVFGTLFGSMFLLLGGSATGHMVASMGMMIMLLLYPLSILRSADGMQKPTDQSKRVMAFSARLLLLIVVGVLVMLAEGFAYDWSTIFLKEYRGATGAFAALGFSLFMIGMTIGRLSGDTLLKTTSSRFMLVAGCILGVSGILIAVFFPFYLLGCIGLFFLGIGCSLNSPILYALAMNLPDTPAEVGLATFATFSFVGFMAGPPTIGWLARLYGLDMAMLFVAGGLLLAVGLMRRL